MGGLVTVSGGATFLFEKSRHRRLDFHQVDDRVAVVAINFAECCVNARLDGEADRRCFNSWRKRQYAKVAICLVEIDIVLVELGRH
jgi:hypothetical protein